MFGIQMTQSSRRWTISLSTLKSLDVRGTGKEALILWLDWVLTIDENSIGIKQKSHGFFKTEIFSRLVRGINFFHKSLKFFWFLKTRTEIQSIHLVELKTSIKKYKSRLFTIECSIEKAISSRFSLELLQFHPRSNTGNGIFEWWNNFSKVADFPIIYHFKIIYWSIEVYIYTNL